VKPYPLVVVSGVLLSGLLAATLLDRWRVGSAVMGVALCLGAVLRLTLPARQAGLLVVRSRGTDAAFLLGVGLAMVALANTIPSTR
jgi:hypothetical protein